MGQQQNQHHGPTEHILKFHSEALVHVILFSPPPDSCRCCQKGREPLSRGRCYRVIFPNIKTCGSPHFWTNSTRWGWGVPKERHRYEWSKDATFGAPTFFQLHPPGKLKEALAAMKRSVQLARRVEKTTRRQRRPQSRKELLTWATR